MTIHVVCRDCTFEALVDECDADSTIETHEEETGHNVDDGPVDDGAELVTDGGRDEAQQRLDQLNDALLEAYAAGFAKAAEFVESEPDFDTDVETLMEKEPVVESHYFYWDGQASEIELWLRKQVDDPDPELVTDGGTEHVDPLEAIDGQTEVEIECGVIGDAIPDCDGWSETVELDEPANYTDKGRIQLPGFGWECPECGNPHEFVVEGTRVTNLV